MHRVRLLDDALLAFETQLFRLFRAVLTVVGGEFVIRNHFGTDDALLKVGVDLAGGLRLLPGKHYGAGCCA